MNKSISDISGKLSTKEIQKETTKQNKYEEKTKNINVSLKFNDNKTNKDIIKKEKVSNTKILVKKKVKKKNVLVVIGMILARTKKSLAIFMMKESELVITKKKKNVIRHLKKAEKN